MARIIKISEEVRDAIRKERAEQGTSYRTLAEKHGVSTATIHAILATEPPQAPPSVPQARPLVPVSDSPEDKARLILQAQLDDLLTRNAAGEPLSILDQQRLADLPAKIRKMGGSEPVQDEPGLAFATPGELRLVLAVRKLEEALERRTAVPVLEDPAIGLTVEVLATSPACAGHTVTNPLDETAVRVVCDLLHRKRLGPHGLPWRSEVIDHATPDELDEFSVKTRDDRP